ncbi:MAG: STAS/SEC14 domain-containing protein [Pseudomonadales bacterium]
MASEALSRSFSAQFLMFEPIRRPASTQLPVQRFLEAHEKVRLYYETAPDFDGIDPSAIWEDTKVGLGHLNRWERFAVVTDVEWIRHAVHLFGFLIPGELRVFSTEEAAQAREWITA